MPAPARPGLPSGLRVRTVRSGEVSLAVAEAGDPTRPTLIMIHGYPDTKEVWWPVMEHLGRVGRGFHVVAYDVRGTGSSTAPRTTAGYDLARLADDFAAVCAAVSGGEPVHLVGHDWGGIQGWEFVCDPRFASTIASFTSIAGPALGHAVRAGRTRDPRAAFARLRRSWYIVALCLPGGPQLVWRWLLGGGRWRRYLQLEGVPTDARYPSPSLAEDGIHGARLYRRNIPRRVLGRARTPRAHARVQLIIPAEDRFISDSYYAAADDVAPGLLRRRIAGSHWAIRTEPALVAEWVAEFALRSARG